MSHSDFNRAALFFALALSSSIAGANSCADLQKLTLANVTIDRAELNPAGAMELPLATGLPGRKQSFDLPAFCRVSATLKPTPASDIKIEVWLPESGWNRKLLAVGNGGWSGAIFYSSMAPGLQRGYAVAGTDTGHRGNSMDGSFAYRQPEKLIDFGWRAVHEMAVTSKAIIDAFYEQKLTRSYWQGCSSGGKQGLKEAQRFPEDFDGIVAGAPAIPWTRLSSASLAVGLAVLPQNSPAYLSRDDLKRVNDAAIAACDADDGVKDGIIDDPRSCAFDPSSLVCDDPTKCLRREQAQAILEIYAPLRSSRTGEYFFAGFARGSELGWGALTAGPKPLGIANDYFRYVVFEKPEWDARTFDISRDVPRADAVDAEGGQLNAADPNLDAFRRRGGKLLMYHGWSDGLIPAQNSIDYFEAVLDRERADSRDAALRALQNDVRLFMVPGMDHCGGGRGANQFDALTALERWVERGEAPNEIESNGTLAEQTITRKLCPYPLIARYDGRGDRNRAASFICR